MLPHNKTIPIFSHQLSTTLHNINLTLTNYHLITDEYPGCQLVLSVETYTGGHVHLQHL